MLCVCVYVCVYLVDVLKCELAARLRQLLPKLFDFERVFRRLLHRRMLQLYYMSIY